MFFDLGYEEARLLESHRDRRPRCFPLNRGGGAARTPLELWCGLGQPISSTRAMGQTEAASRRLPRPFVRTDHGSTGERPDCP
jgi:hypothetical protein